MNPNIKETIEKFAQESYAGLLSFPDLLGNLVGVGVESYFVDYRDQSTIYYLSNDDAYRVAMNIPKIEIQASFDKDGVVSAIRSSQGGLIKYPEFLKLTMSVGCIGYMVWIAGKRVSYFGRHGEVHLEHFPQ
jgi:uncharacterized protein YbcV (DUF1398 family)